MTYDPTQDAVLSGPTPLDTGNTSGGDPHGNQWEQWTLDSSGHWHVQQMTGSAPTKGGHLEWGLWNGQRVQHMVYGSPSSTGNKGVEPTRPPYYQRERYFDPMTGKWAHRWRYTPTNAEVLARRQGLSHDSRGYYRVVSGRRIYMTGHDAAGRRFHLANGKRIWDDPAHWPSYYSKQRLAYQKRAKELKSKLESLREQSKQARSDQHLLKRNIMRRMKDIEAQLKRVNLFLQKTSATPFGIDFSKLKPKFVQNIEIQMEVGTPGINPVTHQPDPSLPSFSTYAQIGRGATFWIRASFTIQNPDWKPGILGQPELMTTKWSWGKDFIALDGIGGVTDEWIVSNPLVLVRTFRAPSTGGFLHEVVFTVTAELYEFTFDQPKHSHPENSR
jgi:hypothetical protein